MPFIKDIKDNCNKAKAKTKNCAKTTKDTVAFTKDTINTLKDAKKAYDEFSGKANKKAKPINKNKNVKQDTKFTNNYSGPIIDVEFEEVN